MSTHRPVGWLTGHVVALPVDTSPAVLPADLDAALVGALADVILARLRRRQAGTGTPPSGHARGAEIPQSVPPVVHLGPAPARSRPRRRRLGQAPWYVVRRVADPEAVVHEAARQGLAVVLLADRRRATGRAPDAVRKLGV